MKIIRFIAIPALLALGIAGYALGVGTNSALSQASYPLPAAPRQVTTIGTSDLVPILPNATATSTPRYAPPELLNNVKGYYTSVPSTGFTYTWGVNIMRTAFEPTGTLSTGAVTWEKGVSDGQEACLYSKSAITTLTLTAATGDTLNDGVSTLAAAGHACYIYTLSSATWNRTE